MINCEKTTKKLLKNGLNTPTIVLSDLLKRKQFEIKRELIDIALKDKIVLVTGGAGSIGTELCKQALKFGCKKLIAVDFHENGIFYLRKELAKEYPITRFETVIATVREKTKINAIFNKFKPNVVFHCSAYKHVTLMETEPCEAVKTNVFGTKNVLECANAHNCESFVLISTDKAVNPSSVMGATKRIAEMLIQSRSKEYNMKTSAVRFGNVLGSSGSVVPVFLEQIKRGGPLTVTDKRAKRYFMTVSEAVALVLQTSAIANAGEIFVLDMGQPISIYDLACALIEQCGLKVNEDIKIEEIGLLKGEKLFEELCYDDESVNKTQHEGIFVSRIREVNETEFNQFLTNLEKLTEKEDDEGVANAIFSCVKD